MSAMRTLAVVVLATMSTACQPVPPASPGGDADAPPPTATQPIGSTAGISLVTDSAEYTVRFVHPMYRTRIGFVFRNDLRDALTRTHCSTPTPMLEKNVNGRWVVAYHSVELMCLRIPHFRIGPQSTYRAALDLAVAPPSATNMAPRLEVDSIPGTYRMRWSLKRGEDPEEPRAPTVEAVSNEFRLVLR